MANDISNVLRLTPRGAGELLRNKWSEKPMTATYEVLSVAGGLEVWRRTLVDGQSHYPEQLTDMRGAQGWLSDYGFGDYEDSSWRAKSRETYHSVKALPQAIRDKAAEANAREQADIDASIKRRQKVDRDVSTAARWRDGVPLGRILADDLRYWLWRALGRRWRRPIGRHERQY